MLFGSFLSAQPILPCPTPEPGCAGTPKNVSRNLITQANYVIDIQKISYAKATLPSTFGDVKYVADGPFSPPHCPGTTTDVCLTDALNLYYNMYFPTPASYTNYNTCALPVIILFHAGGFVECSTKNLPGIIHICEEFALRGFVVYNVEYRRGRIKDDIISSNTTVQQKIAAYRACQDGRGAIRTILKRQDEGYENELYRINKNQIYVGGMSAGGIIAMNAAYYTNNSFTNMVADVFPSVGSYTTQQALGPIDADFYYGEPTISFQTKIKGVLSMWGAIPMPSLHGSLINQSGFFSGNAYNPPLIGFAGAKDPVFPIKPNSTKQRVFFSTSISPAPNLNTENRCLPNNPPYSPYSLENVASTIDLITGSTYNMYNILKTLNIPSEMYIDCQMGHGLDGVFSDFGTGNPNDSFIETYIVQRFCIFFQDNINGIVNGGTTLFIECPNTRGSCNPSFLGCTTNPCSANFDLE